MLPKSKETFCLSVVCCLLLMLGVFWLPRQSYGQGGESEGVSEWTLLFYLAADNEQEAYADATIEQLLAGTKQVGNHPQILVFIDRLSKDGTEVFEVVDGEQESLSDYEDYEEKNSADGDVLQEFATYALGLAKHDKVAFVMKSEGLGWRGIGRDNTQLQEVDDQLMSTGDLAEALIEAQEETTKQVDLLVLEGSIMAFIEVVYELRDAAPFLLATQSKILPDGLPWEMIIEDLGATPGMDSKGLGMTIIDDHLEYYSDKGNKGVPNFDTSINFAAMALFDLLHIQEVLAKHIIWADTTSELFDDIYNILPHARDLSDVGGYGEITDFDFDFDLETFMSESLRLIYEAGLDFPKLNEAVEDYLYAQGELIVYERNPDDGFKLNAAHGLSIWYPPTWNKYDTSDENSLVFGSLMFYPDPAIGLDWLDDSTWLNYLFEYFDRADANLEGYGPDGDEPPKKGVDRDF